MKDAAKTSRRIVHAGRGVQLATSWQIIGHLVVIAANQGGIVRSCSTLGTGEGAQAAGHAGSGVRYLQVPYFTSTKR